MKRNMKTKKAVLFILMLVVMAGSLIGCGKSLEADRDTVYVRKNGSVVSAAIADFNKDYYNEEELKGFVDEKVREYQEEHGDDTVKVDEFSVEEGTAKLYIKYDSYGDYQEFNEVTLFSGSVPQALAEGFDFDAEFTAVQDGAAAGTVDKKTVVDSDCKVVILSEKVDVKVDGTIQYMSSKYTTIKDEDTVSVQLPEDAGDGEESSLVYIVYN